MSIILKKIVRIHASPRQVWEVLAAPSLTPLWNPKCTACDAGDDLVNIGDRYRATFIMSGSPRECRCEVIDARPEQLLKIRYSGGETFKPNDVVEETFHMEADGENVQLRHELDLSHFSFPWWARPLVWFVAKFGKEAERGPLDNLRRLCEK